MVLLEPVDKFVREAMRSARDGEWTDLSRSSGGKERKKRVWLVRGGLQSCEPRFPGRGGETVGVVGGSDGLEAQAGPEGFGQEIVYDA